MNARKRPIFKGSRRFFDLAEIFAEKGEFEEKTRDSNPILIGICRFAIQLVSFKDLMVRVPSGLRLEGIFAFFENQVAVLLFSVPIKK